MKVKQTIVGIALTAGLALTGCGGEGVVNNKRYHLDGRLDNEWVKFSQIIKIAGKNTNYLKVMRDDGKIIHYYDVGNNLTIDRLIVQIGNKYIPVADEEGLKEGQRQFDEYLVKILAFKKDKLEKRGMPDPSNPIGEI